MVLSKYTIPPFYTLLLIAMLFFFLSVLCILYIAAGNLIPNRRLDTHSNLSIQGDNITKTFQNTRREEPYIARPNAAWELRFISQRP